MLMRELSLASVSNRSQNRFLKPQAHLQTIGGHPENCRLLADMSERRTDDRSHRHRTGSTAARRAHHRNSKVIRVDLYGSAPELDDFDLAERLRKS